MFLSVSLPFLLPLLFLLPSCPSHSFSPSSSSFLSSLPFSFSSSFSSFSLSSSFLYSEFPLRSQNPWSVPPVRTGLTEGTPTLSQVPPQAFSLGSSLSWVGSQRPLHVLLPPLDALIALVAPSYIGGNCMPVHSVAWSWRPGQQDFKVSALPCLALPAWYATVRSHPAFYLSFQEVWSSSPLYLFPPPAPQKKCKDLSASPDPGEDTVGEGDRWARLNLWLSVYSLCKHSPHLVPKHPLTSKGSPSRPRTLGRKAAQP